MFSGDTLTFASTCFLLIALGMALAFEFVNGFHDTANAVATVIYTNTLRPWAAVIWSGFWNLVGVLTSAGGVAFTIMALLPGDLVVNVGSSAGFAMVFALLLSAILWNLGTWYLGLPASSSHTLIGAIMGVGLANALMNGAPSISDGVNWVKVYEVFLSLIVSPMVGFACAAALLLLARAMIRRRELFQAPVGKAPPPWWVRGVLVLTCTGVSFGHGSNDGQKGMGLILLILIGILPGLYALNPDTSPQALQQLQATAMSAQVCFDRHVPANIDLNQGEAGRELSGYLRGSAVAQPRTFAALAAVNRALVDDLAGKRRLDALSTEERRDVRTSAYLISATVNKLNGQGALKDARERTLLLGAGAAGPAAAGYRQQLLRLTQFIPVWVRVAVALALGLGTMIGWKRIVVTVGEKIGKSHLTYAQGAAAELVAASTIILADMYKLPVSTTHVLSSGVAGTMAANRSGLQLGTLRNLLLAWVLTLPVCVLLGAATFACSLFIVLNNLVSALLWVVAVGAVIVVMWARRRARERGAARMPSLAGVGAPVGALPEPVRKRVRRAKIRSLPVEVVSPTTPRGLERDDAAVAVGEPPERVA